MKRENHFASMWIRTSEPCRTLARMRTKLSFTIAILLRQYMMELLNCHLLLFTLVLDGLTGTQLTYQSKPIQLVTLEFFHRCEHHSQQSIFEKKVINSENNSFHIFYLQVRLHLLNFSINNIDIILNILSKFEEVFFLFDTSEYF